MKEAVDKILVRYPANKKDKLLPILQDLQEEFGYLTEEMLGHVGRYVNLPLNKVFGVATFYDQFRFKKLGKKHVKICNGTACYLYGSGTILDELEKQLRVKPGQTSKDGKFSLEIVHCLGACEMAPVVKVNDTLYPALTSDGLNQLIRSLKEKNL